ncbi:uncharacterized protein LOC129746568 [Uranotaenia lowii]|uniref:uncharacterized protein LOC129746568 n=1 Tax=Uranotaenia lowii TaxID=190385 RepID=UPI002478EDBD|nr:uncharacterized protein LOC129746568 [Uranotaenia lowii]
MLPSLSAASILSLALWSMTIISVGLGQQAQYRLTQLRPGRPMKVPVVKNLPECQTPYFQNGIAKLRQRNKMVRFTCASGFTLVGNMYSMCEKGRWDTPIPICIRPGCADLSQVENGQISYEHGLAAGMLFCNSGYQVAGSSKTYCNGTSWDRPLGSCRETDIDVPTACDFEVVDWCGWTNEATHDFDWKRSDGLFTPKALKTGPKYDHTTMVPLAGHFLMIDSGVQLTNETARLISPLYPANYSQNACFLFYYHMFGDSVGSLWVYVKPASQQFDSLTYVDAYYGLKGNQRNIWNEGYFDLKPLDESFQIVIEATMGMKFKSDIAIDDVSLLSGDDCRPKQGVDDEVSVASETPEVEPDEVPDDGELMKIGSCENRCGQNVTNANQTLNVVACDCFEGCVETKTCCPDYAERCVFNETLIDLVSSTTVSTTIPSTTPTTSSTTTTTSTTTTVKPVTTPKITTSTSLPKLKTSTPKPTTTTPKTTSPTVKITSTASTNTTPKPNTTSTTKTYNLRPRTTTTTTKPKPFVPMIRSKPTTTSSSTTPETTTSTTETITILAIGSRFGANYKDEYASATLEWNDGKPNLLKILIIAGTGVIIFGLVVMLIVVHIRRNSGANVLNRLKQKSMKKGGLGGSMEAFEDVRFLAADEHLDFSVAEDAEEAQESDGESAGEAANLNEKQEKKKRKIFKSNL